ncbi:dihydrofolate reductase family protein [Cryobacterium fucosi]|uniref:dihydrofolate reductase family protein n=1 Tax=Cryobacterium fucosi TaxID=1259157 RepID=UPI003B97BAE5
MDLHRQHLARRVCGRRTRQLRLERARRGGACLRQRARAWHRHPPVRASDVRGDGGLGHRDLSAGGPGLAKHAIEAGLVDEYHLFVLPVVLGGGTRFLPAGVRLRLELVAERRFVNGVVHLRYRGLPGGE